MKSLQKNCDSDIARKEKKHNIGASLRVWLTAVMIFAVAFGLTSVTYAWLSSRFYEETPMEFTTGTTPEIPMKMWLYTTAQEDGSLEEGIWEEKTVVYEGYDKDEIVIPSISEVIEEEGKTVIHLNPKTLQLGTINNLITTREDNLTYIRFEIDGTEHGKNFTFSAAQPRYVENTSYNMIIFDNDGDRIEKTDHNILDTVEKINERTPFFIYEYFITPNGTLTPEDFTYHGENDGFVPLPLKDGDDLNSYYLEGVRNTNDKYYLYLRLSPNLKSFGESASTLYDRSFVPYVMMFEWDWILEVR